ncbi:MAG: 50S ribosomal protein L16 [Candidatus Aenigmarchaeota archaeon]|nr:50S ribosomal protein L16 [Candidatus Aenigmarchaeota archaeon]
MALRPGRAYRRLHRPYTRQSVRVPRKGYIKGVPKPKLAEYEMGKRTDYDMTFFLTAKNSVQIRHNALESARVACVQLLEKRIGKTGDYFMKIRVYPHHVLRENALATGAGADRFQQGMRQSFGKPVSTAAQVRVNQKIIEVRVNAGHADVAKAALRQAVHKLPTPCKIVVEHA